MTDLLWGGSSDGVKPPNVVKTALTLAICTQWMRCMRAPRFTAGLASIKVSLSAATLRRTRRHMLPQMRAIRDPISERRSERDRARPQAGWALLRHDFPEGSVRCSSQRSWPKWRRFWLSFLRAAGAQRLVDCSRLSCRGCGGAMTLVRWE